MAEAIIIIVAAVIAARFLFWVIDKLGPSLLTWALVLAFAAFAVWYAIK